MILVNFVFTFVSGQATAEDSHEQDARGRILAEKQYWRLRMQEGEDPGEAIKIVEAMQVCGEKCRGIARCIWSYSMFSHSRRYTRQAKIDSFPLLIHLHSVFIVVCYCTGKSSLNRIWPIDPFVN